MTSSPVNLLLHAPGLEKPRALTIPPGTAVLLGRAPSVHDLDDALTQELGWAVLRPVPLPGRWISANHLLIAHHPQQGVLLWDLHSRNGSKLLLDGGQRVQLDGGEVVLALAGAASEEPQAPLSHPEAPDWSDPGEFGPSVARAVQEWLRRQGMDARVQAVPLGDAPGRDNLLLADDSELSISWPSSGTLSTVWPRVLERLRDFLNRQNLRFEQLRGVEEDLILASPSMREAYWQLATAAAHGMRVMILGPTGSGKERMARAYHRHSRRFQGPFVAFNCALLKEDLLYAQLFGAKRGSFTGATSDLPGLVEKAHEGTLFLDEIGDMDPSVQRALLRFLDSHGEYHRLGDGRPRRADVQIVCATNRPIDDPTSVGFREDLWFRLAVRVVRLAPLRERREDIEAFLRARKVRGGDLSVYAALSPPALDVVLSDPLPGNFRDLGNFVERLPPTRQPQGISREVCEHVLYEGRAFGRGPAAGTPTPMGGSGVGGTGDWSLIAEQASAAFLEDHGGTPNGWSQMQLFVEKYLKPVFVAYSCGLADQSELGKGLNYSDLARRLNVADGTTVKMHLTRYFERFRSPRPAAGAQAVRPTSIASEPDAEPGAAARVRASERPGRVRPLYRKA